MIEEFDIVAKFTIYREFFVAFFGSVFHVVGNGPGHF